ncbi:MAG TPA: AI-2E family transporter [Xanthobacteraceae bacterium]|nr:AI-2E family transporter [Xanthobacteraceae bacterium]
MDKQTHGHRVSLFTNGSQVRIPVLVLMAATVAGIYICWLLAVPFAPAIAWALALAVLFSRLHQWLEAKLNRPNLAAAVSVLIAAVIVMVPATFVGGRLVREAAKGALTIKTEVEAGALRRMIEASPTIEPIGEWIEHQIDLPGILGNVASWLSNVGALFVRDSVMQLISVLLTFYLLFYFLRDRHVALGALRSLSPLAEKEMDHLFGRVADTIHATFYGTLVVAAVQGALGGVIFWWLDLPAPLLWGVVMGLLAIIPVFGAFVVWIPVAIFLALSGSWDKALILTAWGAGVVGTIDNILYPMLVGSRLKMHTVLAFISLVGGLIVFGPAGLIVGPVAVSITLLLLEIVQARITSRNEVG